MFLAGGGRALRLFVCLKSMFKTHEITAGRDAILCLEFSACDIMNRSAFIHVYGVCTSQPIASLY